MKSLVPIILLSLILAACGGTPDAATSSGIPAPPRPATVAAAEPTATPDTVLFPNVGQQAYTDPDNRFTLVFPSNWQTVAQPTGGVVFVDPTGRAAFGVQFTATDTQLSPDALAAVADEFVTANFGSDPGFEILSRDKGVIQFKNDDPNLGSTINRITATQYGQMVYFTQMTIVEPLWAQTAPSLQAMLSTLSVRQTEPLPTPTKPLVWELFTSPTHRVAFLVPSNWTVSEDATGVRADWQSSGMSFSITFAPAQDVPQYLQMQLDALAETQSPITRSTIAADTLGALTGYKVDYLYSAENDITMAVSSFAGDAENKLYHITIAAPEQVFPTALDWFIPMLESVQFLSGSDSQ